MKKIFTVMLVAMMSVCAMAQHEVGVLGGGLNGASYKYWFNDNLALQADLAVGLSYGYAGQYYKGTQGWNGEFGMYDFTINPNALYHFELPEGFKLYVGGGFSFGMMSNIANVNPDNLMGKFGVNANVGTCYQFDGTPIVVALDFRPGYGLGFTKSDAPHYSLFDWKLAFAVRYTL